MICIKLSSQYKVEVSNSEQYSIYLHSSWKGFWGEQCLQSCVIHIHTDTRTFQYKNKQHVGSAWSHKPGSWPEHRDLESAQIALPVYTTQGFLKRINMWPSALFFTIPLTCQWAKYRSGGYTCMFTLQITNHFWKGRSL